MTDEAAATQYAKLQEQVERALPKMGHGQHGPHPSSSSGYQPDVGQAHRALLDSERKAWVNAHGSPYLRLRWAGRTSGRCTHEDALMFTREWCRATATDPGTPRQGWFFEKRLPGDVRASKFFVTPQGPELLGAVRFARALMTRQCTVGRRANKRCLLGTSSGAGKMLEPQASR
jgi:hypothetical protein